VNLLIVATFASTALSAEFFVSPDGNDAWSGKLAAPNKARTDGPFASLSAAQKAARAARRAGSGVTVWLRQGTYRLSRPLLLTEEDSGSTSGMVVYSAYRGEKVIVSGSKAVQKWTKASDEAVLKRLPPQARSNVLQADLAAQGFSSEDLGGFITRGMGRPIVPAHSELFVDGQPAQLTRFPYSGWLKLEDPVTETSFGYASEVPAGWAKADDLVVHGFWTWDWADSYEVVKNLDAKNRRVETMPPHGVYGYKKGARFAFYNVLEQLDRPGAYYLDRKNRILYYWPKSETFSAELSVLGEPLVKASKVRYLKLKGIVFEGSRMSGLEASEVKSFQVEGCTFRNMGNYGAQLSGESSGFLSCDVVNTGAGGINISGGDRKALVPGKCYVENCDISFYNNWERTYRPGIHIMGVGNRLSRNRIHDSPHMGILLHGNNHLIEYNEIFRVCLDTRDAGAFYMGRDFTEQGNVLQFNYFHDNGRLGDTQAVYLDDWASGTTVYGNVIVKSGRAVMIGGGRDNRVENNILVDGEPAIHVDARGTGWAKYYFEPNGTRTLFERLEAMDHTKPPFSTAYPLLAKILDDDPQLPKRNTITKNLIVNGRPFDLLDGLKPEQVPILGDNWIGGDPGFMSLEGRNFNFSTRRLLGDIKFKPIPFEKIGLYKDGSRPSVPQVWGVTPTK